MSVNIIAKIVATKEILKINKVPAKYTIGQFQKHLLKLCELTSDETNVRIIANGKILNPSVQIGSLEIDETSSITINVAGVRLKNKNQNNSENQQDKQPQQSSTEEQKPSTSRIPPQHIIRKIEPTQSEKVADDSDEEPIEKEIKPKPNIAPKKEFVRRRIDPKSFIKNQEENPNAWKYDMQDFKYKPHIESPYDKASKYLLSVLISFAIVLAIGILFINRYHEIKSIKISQGIKNVESKAIIGIYPIYALIGVFICIVIIYPLFKERILPVFNLRFFIDLISSFKQNYELEAYKNQKRFIVEE